MKAEVLSGCCLPAGHVLVSQQCPTAKAEGSRGDHLAEHWAGTTGSWFRFGLWDGSVGWQHQVALPVCCRGKDARPRYSRGQCWWGTGTGIAHHPPTRMQGCLPPALWEEMLVLSQREPQNRVTCCSTFSTCGKDVPHVEVLDFSRSLWQ